MEKPTVKLDFPKRFFWGASTAAHQVEGGTHNQWSIWELENAVTRAQQAKYELKDLPAWEDIQALATNPHNYISKKAADHFNRYEEDFDILTNLNMNAFRFSIEWSRIEPQEGVWDAAALEHYRLYLHALKRRHIEPFVTLWHWTVPEWFAEKGGFEKRGNVNYFVRFAEKVLQELGGEFRYVITLNEPSVYVLKSYVERDWPPAMESKRAAAKVYLHLIKAHKKVYKSAKRINRKFKVGLSENCAHIYAGDSALLSRVSTKFAIWGNDFFLRRVKRKADFIGLNYYFTNRFYGNRIHNQTERVSDMGWDMQPQNIQFVLERLHRKFRLPIIVTENGVADMHDEWRRWWLMETIVAMQKALQKGVTLEGYLHWSLLDNFEWADGFWPRFGLVQVNYRTQERTVRESAEWFGRTIKKLRT